MVEIAFEWSWVSFSIGFVSGAVGLFAFALANWKAGE